MSPRATVSAKALLLALALVPFVGGAPPARGAERIDKRAVGRLGLDFFEARPPTRFASWDLEKREALLERARALGPLPEGSLEEAIELVWKGAEKHAPRIRGKTIATPYGEATWLEGGRRGRDKPLLVGLHGGGEGAGSAGEAKGNWNLSGALGIYPQGIRLVHDTWNTVHGEAFVLTLLELAKVHHEIDPDRVYVAGFSMGGSGSWHLAGRHPDLFAGAIPAHGVLMAAPASQVATKDEVHQIQYGLLANVHNLPVWFFTGTEDKNCMPGTFLFAWDAIQQLREEHPTGYRDVRFDIHEGLAHAFPPGQPQKALAWVEEKRRDATPEKLVWEYAANPFPLPVEDDAIARLPKRWFYWLHCARPADGMHVVATRDGNAFDLEATLALPEDFAIYMNPSMIDVEKDVVVRVDGKEVYRGRPVPDLACVLESLDAKLDRTLCFDRKVVIPAP